MKKRVQISMEQWLYDITKVHSKEKDRTVSNFILHCVKIELRRRGKLKRSEDTDSDIKQGYSTCPTRDNTIKTYEGGKND